MPIYTYRREDGTTFEVRQKFSDEPLQADPETGQPVTRIIQNAGIIFKGSGFYVNDSKGSKSSLTSTTADSSSNGNGTDTSTSETSAKPRDKSDTTSNVPVEKAS